GGAREGVGGWRRSTLVPEATTRKPLVSLASPLVRPGWPNGMDISIPPASRVARRIPRPPNAQVACGAASPEGKADEAAFRGGVLARRGGRDLAAAGRIVLGRLRQGGAWVFAHSTLEREGIQFRLRPMPILIITEKTSQARDLRAALGDRFGQILPAEGHLLRLAEPHEVNASWKSWACVLLKPDGLYPTKPATEGNKPLKLRAIAAALKACDQVVLATDCDREGQLIGQEILEHLRYRGTVHRALFTAQDRAGPRESDNSLSLARLWERTSTDDQVDTQAL